MVKWLELLEEDVAADDLERAQKEALLGKDPTEFLLAHNLISQKKLLSALSRHHGLPGISLEHYQPDPRAVALLPEEIARRFLLLPLFAWEEQLYAAVSDPIDLTAHEYVRQLTGLAIQPVLASRQSLEAAITRCYMTSDELSKVLVSLHDAEEKLSVSSFSAVNLDDEEAPAIRLLNYILSQAIHLGASDIHLESFERRVSLRYRVDGTLHEFPPPPASIYRHLVARMKILSNLDIAERRLPQDGRATIQVDSRPYDLRISIIPNLHGEGMVIRVLDAQGTIKDLDDITFAPDIMRKYKKLIQNPHGILLVTGPTGSGKTTTLYASLKEIYTPQKKIITLEDPVEYQLDGITQIQVHPEIGYTFAKGLRAVLRHDPDVIMLGEIRDLESAEIAIQSSLTGHLVLSTLHTNDAPSVVTRLINMGVQPFLVFASLLGVLAQRLVRRLCDECKREDIPASSELALLGLKELPEGALFYRPLGCNACNHLGYRGRLAVPELLEITSEIERLPPDQVSTARVADLAAQQGYRTLQQRGIEMIFQGLTSLEEVLKLMTADDEWKDMEVKAK